MVADPDAPFNFQWLDDSSYYAYAGEGPISDGVPVHVDDFKTNPIRKGKS